MLHDDGESPYSDVVSPAFGGALPPETALSVTQFWQQRIRVIY
jgi:hypothetical protein